MAIVNVREKLTEYFVLLHKKITVNSFSLQKQMKTLIGRKNLRFRKVMFFTFQNLTKTETST